MVIHNFYRHSVKGSASNSEIGVYILGSQGINEAVKHEKYWALDNQVSPLSFLEL